MDNKATIYDVAKAADTSPRSVTRAFQENSPISNITRQRILQTAERLGYKPNKAAARIRSREIKIGIAVKNTVDEFYNELIAGCSSALDDLADFKVQGYIRTGLTDKSMTEAIYELIDIGADGIILCDESLGSDAKQILRSGNIPLLTLVMRSPGLDTVTHVSVDTVMKGRIAGELMSMICPKGRICVFTGDLRYEHHASIYSGFLEEIEQRGLIISGKYDTRDDPKVALQLATDLLNDNIPCDGVFFASANSTEAIDVFIEKDFHPVIIGSDIFPKMSGYMRNGTVLASIWQNPHKQGKIAVMNMYSHITEKKCFEDYTLINPQIVLSSNLCEYEYYDSDKK